MELADYNGWENKFTWLMHLHLSNEQEAMNEVVDLVARTSNKRAAGLAVAQWVQTAVNGWMTGFPGRETFYDEQVRLLVWDLVGSALAYANWDTLVKLLMGQRTRCDNPFTWTLHRSSTTVAELQQPVQSLLQSASSLYVSADVLQEWFRECVDEWFNASLLHRHQSPPVLILVHTLVQNTYNVVCWEHVARAFRPEE